MALIATALKRNPFFGCIKKLLNLKIEILLPFDEECDAKRRADSQKDHVCQGHGCHEDEEAGRGACLAEHIKRSEQVEANADETNVGDDNQISVKLATSDIRGVRFVSHDVLDQLEH